MNIHIFTRRRSSGARLVAEEISKLGHRGTFGPPTPHAMGGMGEELDAIVNWGEGSINWPIPKVLNPHPSLNKYNQLARLHGAGVRVPLALPHQSVSEEHKRGFLPRLASHSEGRDIMKCLRGEATPEFWTEFIPTLHEVRYHIFQGRSIRCGVKTPVHPYGAHPFIRTHRNGWNISYGRSALSPLSEEVRNASREAAKGALRVLEMDFGAVDVGITSNGPVVFEVNSAPGLEGRMAALFAENVVRWAGR